MTNIILQARSPTEINFSLDTNKAQRELIIQLESKNRYYLLNIIFNFLVHGTMEHIAT